MKKKSRKNKRTNERTSDVSVPQELSALELYEAVSASSAASTTAPVASAAATTKVGGLVGAG